MCSLLTQTREQLSKLASPDEFEALATAVLRAAVPAYTSLLHVGTNAHGRTVRSPVDGIDIRVHRDGRHLLLVQHTITARKGLRQKWLNDQVGDIAKAKAIFDKEVARKAIQAATLVLTSTTDPDEALIRDVHAAAGDGLKIDLWSASRIADFLDRAPEGQWLREQQFGTESVRLSASQSRAISKLSLNDYLPLVARSEMVPRMLDAALAEFAWVGRGTGFVIGESGLGKSTALRRLADDWLEQGGITLILAHDFIEQASTIEQAVALGLRHWAPSLDSGCGHSALAFATPERPILLIVEDVNRSTNPRRIIERLVGWSVTGNSAAEGDTPPRQWRLLCPVWRGNAGLADPQLRDRVISNSLMVERFERSEAVEAIGERANSAGVKLTNLQRNDLAMALGDDPLLIGLNNDWLTSSPQGAIQSYLTANIDEAADDKLLASDLRYALDRLADQLVKSRTIFPEWHEIRSWLSGDSDVLAAIRRLIDQGRIIHLRVGLSDDRLMYRHDRVRDHLLIQAMVRLIKSDRCPPELWADPFYAELIGGALSALPITAIGKAATLNPVALFAALQDSSLSEAHCDRIIEATKEWIQSPGFKAGAADQQRHHAMRYLARNDGAFVADLAKRFPFSFPQLEALVRNGDARSGASLCARSEPGLNDVWRDRVIAHALSHHSSFVPDLAELICKGDLPPNLLEGALNLAGEIGDPVLCDALAARWARSDEMSLSTGWLWAALRCCPPIEHPLADTLCDLWAGLPVKVKRGEDKVDRNPRWDIAGYSLPWAFSRKPEPSAITFLVARAKRDHRLAHVLGSILSKVDSTDAVLHSVKQAAKIYRRTEKSGGINLFANDLEQTWSPEWRGRMLSAHSRSTIEQIWRNQRVNQFERKAAFLIWRQTPTCDELASLAALEADPVLADAALRTRLENGDQSAVPLLKQRIWNDEHGNYWWYNARRVGLVGLHEDAQRYLDERRGNSPVTDNVTDADYILAELLMDARDEFSAQFIVTNWGHLKRSPLFVQAALYLATPETVALARSVMTSSGEPEKMLEYIDMHWGIRTSGRRGVTDLAQLQALEPYYALMDEFRILSFFEVANELGALNWREKHLDPLITKSDRGYCTSDKQSLFASLDNEAMHFLKSEKSWWMVDHWFEQREKELWQRREVLAIIGEWACMRACEPAVALLCEALLYFGERPDLALLDPLPSTLRASCSDKIANCIYGVQQRSLSRGFQ
ncbi:hypothetical protein [Pseudomonas chlororaphis]|uniref:hypothetical protein n=1 Tax=Pseudomonas chlororaphis TaxID=587753 RepID=UPI0023650BAE|nr:hypothetical protein [Pseudomonas chlororaphis]WDG52317.1 hypothetical protein PUP76_20915 [Pseudomonas chlororaphis]WDH86666.1 hypothetical protein PUP74_21270 [Pseudomonas chlororaphis]